LPRRCWQPIYPPTDHLIICNADHPRPIWYHADSHSGEFLDRDVPQRVTEVANLPLGIINNTAYHQFAIKLEKEDLVIIYTDSLTESRSPQGKELGERGLFDLVCSLDVDRPQNFNREMLAKVAEYRGQAPPRDDQTLLVLHHNASEPQKMSLGQKMRVMTKMLGLIGD
jgi:serine phosphatase RsbU (regulator of sigma subunit)